MPELFRAVCAQRDDKGNRTFDGEPEEYVKIGDKVVPMAFINSHPGVPFGPGDDYLRRCEEDEKPKRSQCAVYGERHPQTWDEYEQSCKMTFGGGYKTNEEIRVFHHGMATIFNMLRAEFKEAGECRSGATKAESSPLLERIIDAIDENWAEIDAAAMNYAQAMQSEEEGDYFAHAEWEKVLRPILKDTEDAGEWLLNHTEQLDKNWDTHHRKCMSAIRDALGIESDAACDIIDEIRRLRGSAKPLDVDALAAKIAAELFDCGTRKPDSIHLFEGDDEIGGWTESSIAKDIAKVIREEVNHAQL